MNHACHRQVARGPGAEVWGDLVALLVFKTSVGLNKVPGGFDSHPPPPFSAFPAHETCAPTTCGPRRTCAGAARFLAGPGGDRGRRSPPLLRRAASDQRGHGGWRFGLGNPTDEG